MARTNTGRFAQHLCDCGCRTFIEKDQRLAPGHCLSTILCACGCGGEVPWRKLSKYHPPRFIHNHQMRGISNAIKPPIAWIPPTGLCECGCGARTSVAVTSCRRRHQYRGYYIRFIQGHAKKTSKPVNTPTGYLKVRSGGKYLLKHRIIMARMLGRDLAESETVHHRNGNRRDNRPKNLELWTTQHPYGQRVTDLVAWARALLARYGAEFPEH